MLEPSDSQEAYDFIFAAIDISETGVPVLLRVTTRVCHSYSVVRPRAPAARPAGQFRARHPRPRDDSRLCPACPPAPPAEIGRNSGVERDLRLNLVVQGGKKLGIITSGISFMHIREAAPEARVFKLGFTHPLPMKKIAEFVRGVDRC